MPAKLRLATTWNRDPLPATDQPSLAYLVVDIANEDAAENASPTPPLPTG